MKKKNGKNGASWQPERPYVPLPLSLLKSHAWQSASVHTRRLIEFLMIEWASHGGQENGFLLAPRKQLIAFGIRTHSISDAIAEAENLGLIDVIRGKGRAPNRYALTWLPFKGRTEPTNGWRNCQPGQDA